MDALGDVGPLAHELEQLVGKVLGMWRGEANAHVAVDSRYSVEQVDEAATAQLRLVDGREAFAKRGWLLLLLLLLLFVDADGELARVAIAVDVLAEQSDLFDAGVGQLSHLVND